MVWTEAIPRMSQLNVGFVAQLESISTSFWFRKRNIKYALTVVDKILVIINNTFL